MDKTMYEAIYPPEIRCEIELLLGSSAAHLTEELLSGNLSLLQEADVIFSGWGGVLMDEKFLQAAPRLKAVFYGAGSIKNIVTEAFWDRNIRITSSFASNAISVAEYTLSQILFALKGGWQLVRMVKEKASFPHDHAIVGQMPGICGSTVGLVSLGMIGRKVCESLASFDVNIIAYDPYVSNEEAARLNVELCSLEQLFRRADVVSLHAPWLQETVGMVTGEHISSMKKWASFINTSRGAVVNESGMITALRQRPDLQAILDVTYPEPPEQGSPLYTLPNVALTPHIAGATSKREIARMGSYVVEELKRFLNGESAKWEITREKAKIMA